MATEIEILNNIRQDIRQYLGTASNAEVLSTLKAINATLQNLQNTMAKLQAPAPPTPTPTPKPAPTATAYVPPSPITATQFHYQTLSNLTSVSISPLQTFDVFNVTGESGTLYNIWILIADSNAFKLILNVDGIDFGITPDELIAYTTSELNTNNDWQFTYISTPIGPPFAMRFQSVEGLNFRQSLQFSVQNLSNTNDINIAQYRYAYKLFE